MKRRRKYHYETETCYECGHKTRYRVYRRRHGYKDKRGIIVRDVAPLLNALDMGPGPLATLMAQAEKHNKKIRKISWVEDKQ